MEQQGSSIGRMRAIVGHLAAGKSPADAVASAKSARPKQLARSDDTRWNGWGYKDTRLYVNADKVIEISGDRYGEMFDGAPDRTVPKLLPWAETVLGLDVKRRSTPSVLEADQLRVVHVSPYASADDGSLDEFLAAVNRESGMRTSREMEERVRHGHGQTCEDVFRLRHCQEIDRVPDAVVWPTSHSQVELLVAEASKRIDRICLFPFGGGTK